MSHFRCFVLIVLSVLFGLAAASAQSTATISGTVHDSSGAVLLGATVRVTDIGTGRQRTVKTNREGDYVVSNLDVGSYEVAVEAPSFKRLVRRPVNVDVDQTVRVDAALSAGEVSETVVVKGYAQLIDSEQSEIGQVIDNKTIVDLPLNGRNFIQLGTLIPGATPGAPGNTTISTREEGQALSVNGQRAEANNYILDGLDNNEMDIGVAVIIPSIDAIQEFKVETANYSAEFGRAAGAVIQVATRSGTNEYHGSAYEFVRNQLFDAKNRFSATRLPLHQNQYGFSVGGPITIPRLFNGRNSTFFFWGTEWLTERIGSVASFTVPTPAQRQGDFSASTQKIYDPANLVKGVRQQFPGNIIPTGRLSLIALQVINAYPQPTTSSTGSNLPETISSPTDSIKHTLRVDQRISAKDQGFLRLSYESISATTPALPTNGVTIFTRPRGFVVGYTRVFSSSIVNNLRVGAQRYEFYDLPSTIGIDSPTQVGLPVLGALPQYLQFPGITISNYTVLSGQTSLPLYRAENTMQYADTLSWNVGRHFLTLGGDFRAYQFNNYQPQYLSGNYTFTGVFTSATGTLTSAYPYGLSDFLLGLPATETILNGTGYASEYIRNKRTELFLQDDFHVLPKLTMNLGIRWERDGRWTDVYDRWAYFDQNVGQIVYPVGAKMPFTSFPYPYTFANIRDIKRPSNLGFSPRFGVAYRPLNNGSTVIHAAYGLFQDQPTVNPVQNNTGAPPFNLRDGLTSGNTTPELTFGVFPSFSQASLLPSYPSFTGVDPRYYRNGYIQQWNLAVERQFHNDYAVKVAYVGAKGTHLDMRNESNSAPPGAGTIQARRRYPLFGANPISSSNGWSNYNSLQVAGIKRLSHGFNYLLSYTYSKSLDVVDGWGGLSNENFLPQNPNDLAAEYGRSSTDLRHIFTLAGTYEVPRIRRSRILDTAAGGWSISGILNLRSGYPFSILVSSDVANIGQSTTSERAQIVGNPHLSKPTKYAWFNTAAFALPAAYTFGNSGRNILDGPGRKDLDVTISKYFPVYHEQRLQFRGEFFNVANHTNLNLPVNTFGSTTLGVIQSGDGRIGQLALKYTF